MIIQAELRRKQSEYEGEACSVDKVIELPAQRFKQFSRALLADYDFIAENKNAIRHDEDARHCLLILDAEGMDGFLVDPQGHNYARYSAFVPNARSLLTPDMAIDRSYLSPAEPWRDESRDEMLRMTLRVDGKPDYTLVLPADEDYLDAVKNYLDIDVFADALLCDIRFKVPYIGELICDTDCPAVEDYNDFAEALEGIWQKDGMLLTYAAVLEAERPDTLRGACELLRNLDNYVRFENLTAGRYYLRELENEGYIPDTQKKTVYVKSGETTEIEWKNTPITGQIQIVKTSEDYNSMNGWPAGTPIPNTVFEVYNARTNRLVDTIKTDKNGLAVSKLLPLARYKIVESKAAEFYGLDKTPIEVEIEYAGQIVKASMTNKSLSTNVSIKKTGYVEVMPGQLVRYNFADIANNSTTALESFYWRDTLPVKAVRLQTIYTGTWNTPGNYKIVYKTNLSGDTWRTLADNLSTSKNYVLDASPAALGLASNEYVTEFMAAFGIVPSNFRQVEAPRVDCKVLSKLAGGTQFVNTSDAGGVYNGQWIMATSRWVTRVYAPSKPLPRTGY